VVRTFLAAVGFIAAAALVLAGGLSPRGVSAHADLVRAEPEINSKVALSPSQLILHFSQGVKQAGSFIQIEDTDGNRLPLDVGFDAAEAKVMIAKPVSPLPPGVYKVHWQTLSADDDDFHDGDYQLIVLNPDGSDPEGVASSVGPDDGGGSDTVVLIAVIAAVVAGIGGLGYYLRKSSSRAPR
jgi:methionine-rich copper-binding protein CopC